MKRKLLGIANSFISPFGVQLYKSGMDMESAIKQIANIATDVRTVVDIGASDGRWSRAVLPHFPRARFVAVDPLVEREQGLKKLKSQNSRFDYVLCVAGEEAEGSVSLTVGEDLDGSTVGGNVGAVRSVPSRSIDAIVASMQCKGSFLLKFDTHGFEVPILKGAATTLEQTDYIVMEVYNYRHTPGTLLFHEMCALLDTLGFRCFNLADPMLRPLDGALWQMDLFFARKSNILFHESNYGKA